MNKKFKRVRKFKEYDVQLADLIVGLLAVSLLGARGFLVFILYVLIIKLIEGEVYWKEIKVRKEKRKSRRRRRR